MEKLELEVVYENGVLKPPHELPLQPGQKVTITIHLSDTASQRLSGLIHWKGSPEDLDYLLGPDNHPWATEE